MQPAISSQLNMSEFGEHLRRLRTGCGLTMRELAASSGMSLSYISMVETGRVPPPSEEVCVRLSEELGVDPVKLLALRLVETGQLTVEGLTIEQAEELIRRLREE